jgi:uncharacterized membrane protein
MALRNIDVKIRYGYARLKRKIAVYFTLWFLALLAGISLVLDSIFISSTANPLKIWSVLIVLMLAIKLAYDTATNMKKEYVEFKAEHNQTDKSLSQL